MADWADALEDWTQEQILYALRKWRNSNPSRKPNPGHILSILKELRGRAEAKRNPTPQPQEETRDKVSAEVARDILTSAGFAPKKFGGRG